jgi:hypothetical protein
MPIHQSLRPHRRKAVRKAKLRGSLVMRGGRMIKEGVLARHSGELVLVNPAAQ